MITYAKYISSNKLEWCLEPCDKVVRSILVFALSPAILEVVNVLLRKQYLNLPTVGLEPTTTRLRVLRSTNAFVIARRRG